MSDGDYDAYGVKECEAVLAVASKMPNVRESGMDLDPKLGHRYMGRIKEAIMAGIWKSLCPEWFVWNILFHKKSNYFAYRIPAVRLFLLL